MLDYDLLSWAIPGDLFWLFWLLWRSKASLQTVMHECGRRKGVYGLYSFKKQKKRSCRSLHCCRFRERFYLNCRAQILSRAYGSLYIKLHLSFELPSFLMSKLKHSREQRYVQRPGQSILPSPFAFQPFQDVNTAHQNRYLNQGTNRASKGLPAVDAVDSHDDSDSKLEVIARSCKALRAADTIAKA